MNQDQEALKAANAASKHQSRTEKSRMVQIVKEQSRIEQSAQSAPALAFVKKIKKVVVFK
jgi:hypothetical protein